MNKFESPQGVQNESEDAGLHPVKELEEAGAESERKAKEMPTEERWEGKIERGEYLERIGAQRQALKKEMVALRGSWEELKREKKIWPSWLLSSRWEEDLKQRQIELDELTDWCFDMDLAINRYPSDRKVDDSEMREIWEKKIKDARERTAAIISLQTILKEKGIALGHSKVNFEYHWSKTKEPDHCEGWIINRVRPDGRVEIRRDGEKDYEDEIEARDHDAWLLKHTLNVDSIINLEKAK